MHPGGIRGGGPADAVPVPAVLVISVSGLMVCCAGAAVVGGSSAVGIAVVVNSGT